MRASLPAALSAVQDPARLIQLNPLVIAFAVDAADNALWHITDQLKVLCFETTTKYTARFTLVQDGIDSVVRTAGALAEGEGR